MKLSEIASKLTAKLAEREKVKANYKNRQLSVTERIERLEKLLGVYDGNNKT